MAELPFYKFADCCEIAGAVSKIRPRAVRTFGVPILAVFYFSASAAETNPPDKSAKNSTGKINFPLSRIRVGAMMVSDVRI